MVINNEHDNHYPDIDPRDDDVMRKAFLQTHYKAWEWEYEKEYRLTKLFLDGIATTNDRKCQVEDEMIAELVIGLKTPAMHRKEMMAIAQAKGIPVFQTLKVPFRFKIDREQIA